MNRRSFLWQSGGGFGSLALAHLLGREAGAASKGRPELNGGLHHRARAKRVVQLFMSGAASQCDTFDYKPLLLARANQPWDPGEKVELFQSNPGVVMPSPWAWRQYGQCGKWVSGLFPETATCVDDIAFVSSMVSKSNIHGPATFMQNTGFILPGFPSAGGWVSYALGSANKNLPTFVNLGRPSSPIQLTGGYLGASVAATPFQAGETPIPNLYPPLGGSVAERERQMQELQTMNQEFRERYAVNSDIQARAQAYELAARMQLSAPEVVDFSYEPDHVKALYGIDEKETEEFGKQLLLARRLAEKGVRFIQICHAGGGNGAWDSHGDMKAHGPLCRATDKPIAGLIRDLKQRGMLDETLVVWTSEFGRTPWSQNTTGRDHNPKGYSSWMAGGGIKGGVIHGGTDEVGYKAVDSPHYCSDLHATILHQLGLNHNKMEIQTLGRTMRLIEDGSPIRSILA